MNRHATAYITRKRVRERGTVISRNARMTCFNERHEYDGQDVKVIVV